MMSAPLRQSAFWEILGDFPQSLSEARPARTSAAPTPKAKVSKANAPASSSKRPASSVKSDLVGSLLRTALISELGALTPFSLRWRHSDTPAGRSWFVLATSEPITNGPAHGSSDATLSKLPAPMAIDGRQDGKGGGSGATYPLRMILATPRKSDADRGFRGDLRAQLDGQNNRHAGMLPTPVTQSQQGGMRWEGGAGGRKALKESGLWEVVHPPRETLPTPLASDRKGSLGRNSRGKAKSPNMPLVISDALTGKASDKWQYARQIAALLTQHNLSGASMTLPVVYGWMMGFPPGWLERALLSAVQEGHLPQASLSKPTGTRSSRKSPKPSDAPS